MAMALTKDERLVLRYIASGRSIEEIAATLNWPLQAVRWTCTHPLIAWVLNELEASTTPADFPGVGTPPRRERTGMKDAALTTVGFTIGVVLGAIRLLVLVVVGLAIVLGFAHALGFI